MTADLEPEIHRVIGAKCVSLDSTPRAIGRTADHVHLLVQLHPSVPLARLVAEAKGSSSHAVNRRLAPGSDFRWQTGYGAFTISPDDLPAVERYVLDQKRHRGGHSVLSEFEPVDEE